MDVRFISLPVNITSCLPINRTILIIIHPGRWFDSVVAPRKRQLIFFYTVIPCTNAWLSEVPSMGDRLPGWMILSSACRSWSGGQPCGPPTHPRIPSLSPSLSRKPSLPTSYGTARVRAETTSQAGRQNGFSSPSLLAFSVQKRPEGRSSPFSKRPAGF